MEAIVFERRIKEAVRRLMATRGNADRIQVSVPVLYPSGATSAVEVALNGDTCFVSDMGVGHTEALLGNASDFYGGIAKRAADRFGIGFDGQAIFTLRAALDRIEGAIAAVSNASVQAASLSILKAEEDKDRRRNDEVYDRVRSIFGPAAVEKVVELEGRHAQWSAHNVVSLTRGRRAVFEFVNNHQNSISSKYMMFSDLAARIEQFISLNAVVRSVDTLGVKGRMLHDVATVISLSASNDDFKRFAEAA